MGFEGIKSVLTLGQKYILRSNLDLNAATAKIKLEIIFKEDLL